MAGFSNFKAFTGGVLSGVEDSEAKKSKIDDEYRQMALKVNAEAELNQIKLDQQQKQDNLTASKINSINNASNVAATQGAVQAASVPTSPQVSGAQATTALPPSDQVATDTSTDQSAGDNSTPPSDTQDNTQAQATVQQQSSQPSPQQAPQVNQQAQPAQGQTPQVQPQAAPVVPQTTTDTSTTPTLPRLNVGNDNWIGSPERAAAMMAHYKKGVPVEGLAYAADKDHDEQLAKQSKDKAELTKLNLDNQKTTQDLNAKSGANPFGYQVGSVPEGYNAPVDVPAANASSKMDSTHIGMNIIKEGEGLQKDEDTAQKANEAATNFKRYLTLNQSADSAGLNKIDFFRNVTSSLSQTDATADAVNKELTFGTIGTQRIPGMRITQQEFMILREAMPSRGNPPEANKNIANYWVAKLQTPQDWVQFKQDYIALNGQGSWNEARGRKMFEQYTNDNPIFDPKALANPDQAQVSDYKLNPNRVTLAQYGAAGGWSNFFPDKNGNPQAKVNVSPPQQPAQDNSQQQAPKVIGTWNPQTGKIE